MLFLKNISLFQFKNYSQANFAFSDRVVCLGGRNGAGKTNLLDAIYYLCFTKSYFSAFDQQNVHLGSAGFRVHGEFELDECPHQVVCILRENGKKEMLWNDLTYERLAGHIGKFPAVVIAPDDVQIIAGGSEGRRRYLDAQISQIDYRYLQYLIDYNKILQQRNSLLRTLAEQGSSNPGLLDVYDSQLLEPAAYIFHQRVTYLATLLPAAKHFYNLIAAANDQVHLGYRSQLQYDAMEELLASSRTRDLVLQRTSCGPHKDELELSIQGQPFKQIASQGQRKSLLLALRLAEYEQLKLTKGFAPLLLLDDVFEKLDLDRLHNFLKQICSDQSGQIFITDTHQTRMDEHLRPIVSSYQRILVGT